MKRTLLAIIVTLNALRISAQDPWCIKASKIDSTNYYGITVANGTLGLVSSFKPMQTSCVVMAGCYDKFGRGEVSNFLKGFNMLNTTVKIDGEQINEKNADEYTQALDMRHAIFKGNLKFKKAAEIDYQIVALRQMPCCAMMSVRIMPMRDMEIEVANIQQMPQGFKNGKAAYENFKAGRQDIRILSTESDSPTGYRHICACTTFMLPKNDRTNICTQQTKEGRTMNFRKKLKKGEPYEFQVIGATSSNANVKDPANEVKRLVIYAQMQGNEKLMERHKKEWEKLWTGDIVIQGDKQAQQDVRSMLYHLYAFIREESQQAISPMGLSGLGYNGHVFWDMETWMLPPLLLLQPKLARTALDYRYNRLMAAKRNARAYGYEGAKFPWESAESGEEETPVRAITGPFEHSITGCIGFAAWQYYCVTHDKKWLKERGFPLIKETADFWISRINKTDDGKCHIENVVAADEWAENVDDDAFTNGIAKINLICAKKAAKVLGEKIDKRWEETAKNIVFEKNEQGVTKEHANYQGEYIKQADANLLAFPLKLINDKKQIKRDLEYYEKKVPKENTPAMTEAMFALIWARMGNKEKAGKLFKESYEPNILKPFRVIAETKGGENPYFATAAGGVLQCVIMGFAGVDIDMNGGIRQVNSVMPKGWEKLTVKGVGKNKKTYVREQRR